MRLNKLFMGLALGLTLVTGVSGTAEAKSNTITVKVDKADAATAKKVDAAFKKGKAVTLKVRGSKKASKALLIDLQKKTAKTMRLSIHFDLDNGNDECQGKGNKFHTYKDLDYKQSGNYGCYTFSKSTCNAYKYAFKFIKGNVDKQINAIDKAYANYKSSFGEDASGNNSEFISYMVDFGNSAFAELNIPWDDASADFLGNFVRTYLNEKTGQAPSGSVDKLVAEALSNGANKDFVEALVAEADSYDLSLITAEPMSIDEYVKENYKSDIIKFYNGGALEVDFSRDKSLAVRGIYLGFHQDKNSAMVYGGLKGVGEYDASRKMKAYALMDGTDEFRFKSLVNKTAHGVCEDYTAVNRAFLDYFGYRSYRVANDKENHAVCAMNYKGVLTVFNNDGFEQYYSSFDKDFDASVLPTSDPELVENYEVAWNIMVKNGWSKCFKDAMGSDYPF